MPAPPPDVPPRCWTVVGPEGAVDVEVSAADDDPLGAVLPVLTAALGVPAAGVWSGSTRLGDDLPLTSPLLAHGAVLGLGRPTPRDERPPSPLELHVVGGPAAGTTVGLASGRHVVGRGAGATLPLPDPGVSRRHVRLDVGAGGTTVTDLGSTNGTRLDDRDLTGPAAWPDGAPLRVGATTLAVTGPRDAPAATRPAPGGRVLLQPGVAPSAGRPETEVVLPGPPEDAPRRRLAWVAVLLPAVAGAFLAWALATPTFLFFALLSPLVAVGTWVSDRWTGRRSVRRAAAAHAEEVAAARARLAGAVRADVRAAARALPDLAALAGAARRRTALLWSRGADDLVVRLGLGPGPTRVVRVEEGRRHAETAGDLPVDLDLLRAGGLGVTGPRAAALGVAAGVLAQVAALHPPGDVDVALLAAPDRARDWAWARWLPHLAPGAVHARAGTAAGWLAALVVRPGGRLLLVVDRPVDDEERDALRRCRAAGALLLSVAGRIGELPVSGGAAVQVGGETGDTGLLDRGDGSARADFTADRLPRPVAARLARDLAALDAGRAAPPLPRTVRLLDLVGPDDGGPVAVAWSRARDSLRVPLGRTAEGTAVVDLCRDGPHALVAGTTGSGKSELLQTLVAGLALASPPDRCSFLLVDYKGGAAFAEAASLPHTVGLVTDLDAAATARALRSLTAELTRREALLAAAGVADLAALPDDVALARLVIVVDEFAGLAEELPEFVSGLVGIAQRGRSLGVHLVLATQRPGGVVSPEIRANCSLRLCLRTTDEADSRDVLGGPEAARVPADRPGGGLLRVGSTRPVAFQAARVASTPPPRATGPAVRRRPWPPGPASDGGPGTPRGVTDLARIAEAVTRAAGSAGGAPPHRPWQPALPDRLPAADLPAPAGPGTRLPVGLVDRPDRQAREVLALDLTGGGGWLAVGGPRSGRTTLLRTVLAEAVTRLTPDRLHVHVLDHGGGALAAEAARLPHTGTVVGAGDALRTVRLLARLTESVAARRASPEHGGPPVLLLVDGVESLMAQLDEALPGQGSAELLRLLRDGAAAGLTGVLTADRAVPGGRLAAVAGTRLVLPLPDRADYAVAGVPVRAVPATRPPGRALLGEDALECQLALPRPLPAPLPAPFAGPAASTALRIPELPPAPVLPPGGGAGDDPLAAVPLGPGGDEGTVLHADLRRGGGLLVVGPPRSGRTGALAAVAGTLAGSGVPVAQLVRGRQPVVAPGALALAADDVAGWHAWLRALDGGPGVLLVDDAGPLADAPVLSATSGPSGRDVVTLAAGTAGELSGAFRGPVADLRRSRSGLLLCPGPGDAELLGIRLPRTPVPVRPGSGWLVTAGVAQRVQVARHAAGGGP
ncbi:FtsK/SpoIIIE domain-containing protein [Geodermatophilus sp. FMUSA9-8]|uniref:FtsK/SpoIIIE domain-containing protein n=1 Tax=Geodermatophilus sp. FMUSA9-8 TaxID=3120155 RepID=UPI00300963A3